MARMRRRGSHAAAQRAPQKGSRVRTVPVIPGRPVPPAAETPDTPVPPASGLPVGGLPESGPPISGPPAGNSGQAAPPAGNPAAPSPSAWPLTPPAGESGSEPLPDQAQAPAGPAARSATPLPELPVVSGLVALGLVAPDPVAPGPVAPGPVAPGPVAPGPVVSGLVALGLVAPDPVAPGPVGPGPVRPRPVAPNPVSPSPSARPGTSAAAPPPGDLVPPMATPAVPVPPTVPAASPFPASAPLDVPVPPSAPLDMRVPPSAPLDVPVPPSAPLAPPRRPLAPPRGPLALPSGRPPARPARTVPAAAARPEAAAAGWRASLTPKRAVAAVCAVVVLALMLVSARSPDPSIEPTVQQFLLAWEQGQYRTAAALTTGDPDIVTSALRTAYQQLDAADITLSMGRIIQHGDTGVAQFNASIDLGRSGAPWRYQGQFALRRIGSTWKVVWRPSVIHPGLQPGLRLAVVTTMPKRAALLDASGRPLARRSRVVVAGVRPGRLTHPQRTADLLAEVTHLPASEVYGEILAAPSAHFFELVRLRPSTYRHLSGKLRRVPGLIIKRTRLRLFDSAASSIVGSVGTETAKVLRIDGEPYRPGTTVGLSGLQLAYQHFLVGTPTTEVVAENAAGRHVSVLKSWPGSTGKPVRTTIDAATQGAADSAIRSLPGSAAIVAVRASDGKILAVATHKAHGMPAVSALDGRYRPGQAFTIVSTAALVSTGFNVATRIPCMSADPVGGRTFRNSPRESGLGALPAFRTDFARGCSTAFAGLSQRLHPSELTSVAGPDGFGFGAQWQLPLRAFAGSLGNQPDDAQLAADSIGAGTVRASPLDMALVAAIVQSGTWHRPTLVTSPPDPGLAPRAPFGPKVVGVLRSLMRRTVTSGAGRAANIRGATVYGQVGNVVLGTGQHGLRASWFVGYRGGVAFAVLEFTRSARTSAAPVAGEFLRELSGSR